MIDYQCPGCEVTHRASPALAGRRIRCPRCGVSTTIPAPPSPAPKPSTKNRGADTSPSWSKTAPPRFPWVMLGLVGAAALVFVSAGLLLFPWSNDEVPPEPNPALQAKNDDPEPADPPDTSAKIVETKKEPEKKAIDTKGPEPKKPSETKPAVTPPRKLRAAALLAEYRAAPADTDRRYAEQRLEIQGPFARLVTSVPGQESSAGPFVQLAVKDSGPFVTFALDPAAPREVWQGVAPGQSVTLRGTYWKGLALVRAEAVRLQAPGDDLYKGKVVELVGVVERFVRGAYHKDGFPTLELEPDAADSLVRVECLFRRNDEKLLEGMRVGVPVIVLGTCGGRERGVVRLHNCQVVPADLPPTLGALRVSVRRFTRAYEEDLRDVGAADDGPPLVIASKELIREFTADPAAALAKYQGKELEVVGAIERIEPRSRSVTFEGNTDQRLRVVCLFTSIRFGKVVRDEPVLTVRGVCRGLLGPTIHLESCEVIEEKNRERLGAAYYPFVPGRTLTFDLVRVAGTGERRVVRQRLTLRKGGVVETATIRNGVLKRRSLFDDDSVSWYRKVVERPGPTVHYRLQGGNVEIGLPGSALPGKGGIVWEPILKGGATVGDTWTWKAPRGQFATYTLDRFTEHLGYPAAVVIRKLVTKDRPTATESVHVYVKGVGEVERRSYEVTSKHKGKRLVDEMRLVEWPAGIRPPRARPAETETIPIEGLTSKERPPVRR